MKKVHNNLEKVHTQNTLSKYTIQNTLSKTVAAMSLTLSQRAIVKVLIVKKTGLAINDSCPKDTNHQKTKTPPEESEANKLTWTAYSTAYKKTDTALSHYAMLKSMGLYPSS